MRTRGGGTSIETLYGDVPPKWVRFWQKIHKHGSHFWPQKSLNMGPFFASPGKFQKIPKHGFIFWAKSLNMGKGPEVRAAHPRPSQSQVPPPVCVAGQEESGMCSKR